MLSSIKASLVPSLMAEPGFVRYRFIVTADDRAVSESVWETDAAAASADVVEAAWVRADISSDLAGLPDLLIGSVELDTGQAL